MAATRNLLSCEACLVATHDSKDCSQRDASEGDMEGRLRSMKQTIQNLFPDPLLGLHQLCLKICPLCIQEFPKNLPYYAQVSAYYA